MVKLNQCPQCSLWYPPTENYCEMDGAQLTVCRLMFPRLVRGLDRLNGCVRTLRSWQPRRSKRRRLLGNTWGLIRRLSRKLDPRGLAYDDTFCIGGEPG